MNRLFLAVPIRLHDYKEIQKDFHPLLEGRWRDEETLHVTIAFLGERFEPEVLLEKLSDFDFSFELSQLSRFDYFTKSHVFIATSVNPTLQLLYQRLQPLFDLENAFLTPHVTLMRVKKIAKNDLFFNRLKMPSPHPIGILEPCVRLYKSALLSEGARYESIAE
ncbi:MAG: hypothetical protein NTY39_01070 [Campylobacterales bacterium]|nr:hypothetical protein [Campylobacterales bacterium]